MCFLKVQLIVSLLNALITHEFEDILKEIEIQSKIDLLYQNLNAHDTKFCNIPLNCLINFTPQPKVLANPLLSIPGKIVKNSTLNYTQGELRKLRIDYTLFF
jgi:hypothetical protein